MISFIIYQLFNAYSMIIFVYVLMSWLPTESGILADINKVLGRVCDPYLDIFRKFIPPIGGMVDVSPIIALIVLQMLGRFVYIIL